MTTASESAGAEDVLAHAPTVDVLAAERASLFPSGELSSEGGSVASFLRHVVDVPEESHPDARVGSRLGAEGRYLLERTLGRGGMGVVYAAQDTLLLRKVALKLLDGSPSSERAARVLREAQIAAALEHERVARVYDVGTHQGARFVAMELVRGTTLRHWISKNRASGGEVLAIATQIAEGMAALHARRVVHRDLKPENVMLSEQSGVKLLDFGLASQTLEPQSPEAEPVAGASVANASVRTISGTPGYMAPEQYAGEALDARADVFAFGVMLFEIVEGRRPFVGRNLREIHAASADGVPPTTPELWAEMPVELQRIMERSLSFARDMRFADGMELLETLRSCKETELPSSSPLPTGWALHDRSRLGRALRSATLLGVVALAPDTASGAQKPSQPPAPAGMAWIRGGAIITGRDLSELGETCGALGASCDRARLHRELPRQQVRVQSFALDVHEVSNRELARTLELLSSSLFVAADEDDHYPRYVRWNQGLDASGHFFVDLHREHGGIEYTDDRHFRARAGREDEPAVQVSWHGARLHCEQVGKRLPTETEWEAAARGEQNRIFPWGANLLTCNGAALPQHGVFPFTTQCPALSGAVRVGSARGDVTPEGIHDLGGNVAEWTSSVFVEGERVVDGKFGQTAQVQRVIRGGSWANSWMVRTSARVGRPANSTGANLGFRCARDI